MSFSSQVVPLFQIGEVQQMLTIGLQKSVLRHKVSVPAAVARLKEIAEAEPENTFFFKPFSSIPEGIPLDTR